MLEIALFVVCTVILMLIYLKNKQCVYRKVPGPRLLDKKNGHLAEINKAGSLHEFLMELHKEYGQIVSFWLGQLFVVSTASVELFKEFQHSSDRPPVLYMLFEPLFGIKSITYAVKEDGATRRKHYDDAFSHDAVMRYYETFQNIADNVCAKWATKSNDDHVALNQDMSAFALKAVLVTLMGDTFKDDKDVSEFRKLYDIVWTEMEKRLTEDVEKDSDRTKIFNKAKDEMFSMVRKSVEQRKKMLPKTGERLLLDIFIEYFDDEEAILHESMSYVVAGFHTSGNLLTWAFYYMAIDQGIQERVYNEIRDVLGHDDVDPYSIKQLVYLRQVIDETLRCAVIAPWCARYEDNDCVLGGYKIPKETPVIQALGVLQHDETTWPQPEKFDPDRFSPENSKTRHPLAFKPFGFAGRRMCPGYRFSYAVATVCIVTLLRKFKVKMVADQDIKRVYGLVTHPSEEIWVRLEKR